VLGEHLSNPVPKKRYGVRAADLHQVDGAGGDLKDPADQPLSDFLVPELVDEFH
jgi:hypothetical protein